MALQSVKIHPKRGRSMQQTDAHFAAQTEEAARRADRGGYVVFTSFLNMAQISDL